MGRQRRRAGAGNIGRVEKLGDRAVLRDFFRTRWAWVFLASAVLLAVTVALIVFPLTNPSDEAADARAACRAEVERQLKDARQFMYENDESFEQSGKNTWNIRGTIRFAGTDLREYECVYTGTKVADLRIQKR